MGQSEGLGDGGQRYAIYTNPQAPFLSMLIVAGAFAAVKPAQRLDLGGFRHALRGFLADPVRLKWFNVAMGLLLAASLWPMPR